MQPDFAAKIFGLGWLPFSQPSSPMGQEDSWLEYIDG